MYLFKFIHHSIQILEGYLKWLYDIITGSGSEKSIERLKLCSECEHNSKGICSLCGCIIKAKVRVKYPLDENGKSVDGCPKKRW